MITLAARLAEWADTVDALSDKIERAIRAGRTEDAFKWLNVMDLVDTETAEYYREDGWRLLTDAMAPRHTSTTISII